jgi:hypothetical protein
MILRRDSARFDPVIANRFDKTNETRLIWADRVEDISWEKSAQLFSSIAHTRSPTLAAS